MQAASIVAISAAAAIDKALRYRGGRALTKMRDVAIAMDEGRPTIDESMFAPPANDELISVANFDLTKAQI